MASIEHSSVHVLKSQVDIDQFHVEYPQGYTILDGVRGVGVTGEHANFARNCGSDPNQWISFAATVSAAIHKAHE